MLNKFLILIGLKQPEVVEVPDDIGQNPTSKVLPSSEKRFVAENDSSEITVHSTEEEVEIRALRSWSEIETLGNAIKENNLVCVDLRDVYDKNERQRIIDFTSGMVHVLNSKFRIIHPDGVYLVRKKDSNLTATERNRLESLGLYKV